ncbi:MAG: DUF1275 domain-containing protein [Clostridia bacterium]|nr:DUF1275 domain-containing protein [Clostridia bacterium]
MDQKAAFAEETEKKTEERNRYLFALIFVGGFFGAFTFCLRGGVFCNAQTGNLLLASVYLAMGNISAFFSYFISLVAFFVGVMVATFLSAALKTKTLLWHTVLLALEMLAVLALGFIPDSASFRITQIAVNVITAMQFTTFRQVNGEAMASTFCTNHLRQTAEALTLWLSRRTPKNSALCFYSIWQWCYSLRLARLARICWGGCSAGIPFGFPLFLWGMFFRPS